MVHTVDQHIQHKQLSCQLRLYLAGLYPASVWPRAGLQENLNAGFSDWTFCSNFKETICGSKQESVFPIILTQALYAALRHLSCHITKCSTSCPSLLWHRQWLAFLPRCLIQWLRSHASWETYTLFAKVIPFILNFLLLSIQLLVKILFNFTPLWVQQCYYFSVKDSFWDPVQSVCLSIPSASDPWAFSLWCSK